jgi:LuxR family transcriptional regulator, regulator of acetate metabolism
MTYPLSIAEACYGSLAERVWTACLCLGTGTLDHERLYRSLHDQLVALTIQIAESCPASGARDAHEHKAKRLLDRIAARHRELHVALAAQRTQRMSRINESMAWFGSADSPVQLARRAPAVLCAAGGFDRVMISRVQGSTWIPGAVHIAVGADDRVNAGLLSSLPGIRVPLTSSLVETGVLRHRTPALVDAALRGHTDGQLGELSRSWAYVVAPIVVADRVTGFLHADTYTSRRVLTCADKVSVQAFADMFGLMYERAAMRQRLRDQQQAVAGALSGAMTETAGSGTGVAQLIRPESFPAPQLMSGGDMRQATRRCGLTGQEWDILRLLATGATNSQIASALVVSESTVKSHIKRILRKLPAANRAEAVYRYTKLAGEESQAS